MTRYFSIESASQLQARVIRVTWCLICVDMDIGVCEVLFYCILAVTFWYSFNVCLLGAQAIRIPVVDSCGFVAFALWLLVGYCWPCDNLSVVITCGSEASSSC